MFANENSTLQKVENYMKKLTKIHDDLVKLEGCHKKKKLAYFKISIFEKVYERSLKLFILMITIFIILYCYYFYIFVIYNYKNSGIYYQALRELLVDLLFNLLNI